MTLLYLNIKQKQLLNKNYKMEIFQNEIFFKRKWKNEWVNCYFCQNSKKYVLNDFYNQKEESPIFWWESENIEKIIEKLEELGILNY